MDQILDRLWCGSYADAQRLCEPEAVSSPITYVLNVSQYACANPYIATVHYPIHDEFHLPGETWQQLTHLLSDLLVARHVVFVHCRLGKSRAPSLCAAYLIRCGFSPAKALKWVRLTRALADPHPAIWQSVLAWSDSPPLVL